MNKKPIVKNSMKLVIFLVCLGVILLASGLIVGGFIDNNSLAGRIIGMTAGFGSGTIAVAFVYLVRLKLKPETARQQEINENDERLIKIREKSAQSTWYVTLFCLSALVLVFMLLDYMIPCYIVIGVMAIHVIGYFAFLYQNSKKL